MIFKHKKGGEGKYYNYKIYFDDSNIDDFVSKIEMRQIQNLSHQIKGELF
jgi:hypothetical protein